LPRFHWQPVEHPPTPSAAPSTGQSGKGNNIHEALREQTLALHLSIDGVARQHPN
jgi:hypothetical protein